MTDWPAVPLHELVTQHTPDRVTPEADDIVRFAGVRWYGDGLFVREERRGSAVKAKCYALKPGLLVYNRLFAWKQSFAVVTDDFEDVVVSNEFPQFEVDRTRATPEFLALYCSSPVFAVRALALSSGAAAVSRNRLKEADFLGLEVACPPVDIQERIVEAVASVDRVIEALATEVDAANTVRTVLLDELLKRRDDSWSDMPIGKVGTVIRGKRFIKADYVDEGIGCIHYAQIHTDFGAHTDEVLTWVPETMRSKLRYAKPGDLVIAGTSENLDGVLKAVAWLGDEEVAVHDDAYIFDHDLEPRYASFVFASPAFRAQLPPVISDTKVVRVSKDALERLTIPVPPHEMQEALADTMDVIDRQVQAASNELAQAKVARAALLDALLTRKIEPAPVESPDGP